MGCHLFAEFTCPHRPGGEVDEVLYALRASAQLTIARERGMVGSSLRIPHVEDGKLAYRETTLRKLEEEASALDAVVSTCRTCPANFRRGLGMPDVVGCHARVNLPLDPEAEAVLFDALEENARPERFETQQGNLVRALAASERNAGNELARLANTMQEHGRGDGASAEGRRHASFAIEGRRFNVSVYAIEEALFLPRTLPVRMVQDVVAFFRSFYAVVGRRVAGDSGKLDKRRNEAFWASSRSLREINVFAQGLHHAAELGVGARIR